MGLCAVGLAAFLSRSNNYRNGFMFCYWGCVTADISFCWPHNSTELVVSSAFRPWPNGRGVAAEMGKVQVSSAPLRPLRLVSGKAAAQRKHLKWVGTLSPEGQKSVIPIAHLPWHSTRADIVPLRFLPIEPVASAEHEKKAQCASLFASKNDCVPDGH